MDCIQRQVVLLGAYGSQEILKIFYIHFYTYYLGVHQTETNIHQVAGIHTYYYLSTLCNLPREKRKQRAVVNNNIRRNWKACLLFYFNWNSSAFPLQRIVHFTVSNRLSATVWRPLTGSIIPRGFQFQSTAGIVVLSHKRPSINSHK